MLTTLPEVIPPVGTIGGFLGLVGYLIYKDLSSRGENKQRVTQQVLAEEIKKAMQEKDDEKHTDEAITGIIENLTAQTDSMNVMTEALAEILTETKKGREAIECWICPGGPNGSGNAPHTRQT